MHAANIVHLDLRGENVFIGKPSVVIPFDQSGTNPASQTGKQQSGTNPAFQVKIGDFGLARSVFEEEDWDLGSSHFRKPACMWMAPEEMAGEVIPGWRGDDNTNREVEKRRFGLDLYRIGLLIASIATVGHKFGPEASERDAKGELIYGSWRGWDKVGFRSFMGVVGRWNLMLVGMIGISGSCICCLFL